MADLLSVISLNWPAALCLLAGFALVTVEIFLPGFGAPGITGIVLLLAGIVVAADSALEAILLLLLVIALLSLLLFVVLRSTLKGKLSKSPLVLENSLSRDAGFSSAQDFSTFLGREGLSLTPLRPAGSANFEGNKLDVVADGEFIAKGQKIVITKVEGARIVVRGA
ncbi:MAG: hypothetical protein LBU47_07485 [Christensenellaceae bacterium]|jgi:membrane-bound ClpP family serine protease|nr:hypothetical protein [Christensenellaceae bacterium]